MNIKIDKIEPKLKDGEQISGQSKYGTWTLWKINDKYDYFAGPVIDLEEGKTYTGEVKEEKKGEYTNLSLKIEDKTPVVDYGTGELAPEELQPEKTGDLLLIERLDKIDEGIDALNKRLDSLGDWLTDNVK